LKKFSHEAKGICGQLRGYPLSDKWNFGRESPFAAIFGMSAIGILTFTARSIKSSICAHVRSSSNRVVLLHPVRYPDVAAGGIIVFLFVACKTFFALSDALCQGNVCIRPHVLVCDHDYLIYSHKQTGKGLCRD